MPEDITDNEGRLIWRGRYSTWGKLVHEHTTSHAPRGFTQPLRMQGQYDDGNTGLYYNTFRYYDADAGRFSAEDPIGLAGGVNLYQYATNPTGWADPLGLTDMTVDFDDLPEPPDINAGYGGAGVGISGHIIVIGGSVNVGFAYGLDGQRCFGNHPIFSSVYK